MSEKTFTEPLAQDFTVIQEHEAGTYRTDAPALVKLPSGRLVSSYVMLPMPVVTRPGNYKAETWVKTSDDNGLTWQETARLPNELGLLFFHGKRLYLVGVESGRGGLMASASENEGLTWTPPKTVIPGRFWNTSTGRVIKNGTLYWCAGAENEAGGFNGWASRSVILAADLTRDITEPPAWRKSVYLYYPGTPQRLRLNRDTASGKPYADHHLEGSVFEVKGGLRAAWRVRIEGHATCSIAMVCDIEDNGTSLDYRFTQFYPFPGAQNHFHIIRDGETGVYWMTSNMQTHSQDRDFIERGLKQGMVTAQRQILALHCSFDALNWLPAGYLVIWEKLSRSSNYVTPAIDGKDLIFASRTSYNAQNQHDNDMVTFHRVRNFRRLSRPLTPKPD